MIGATIRRIHRNQAGFTLVELIVAMTVSSLVMVAISGIFLVAYRIQSTWQEQAQARLVGLTAEAAVSSDARDYVLVERSPTLTFAGVSALGGTHFTISYTVDAGSQALVRSVRDQSGAIVSLDPVAHGIVAYTVTCRNNQQLDIALQAISGGGDGNPGAALAPDLVVTPRNGSCS